MSTVNDSACFELAVASLNSPEDERSDRGRKNVLGSNLNDAWTGGPARSQKHPILPGALHTWAPSWLLTPPTL